MKFFPQIATVFVLEGHRDVL